MLYFRTLTKFPIIDCFLVPSGVGPILTIFHKAKRLIFVFLPGRISQRLHIASFQIYRLLC